MYEFTLGSEFTLARCEECGRRGEGRTSSDALRGVIHTEGCSVGNSQLTEWRIRAEEAVERAYEKNR